MFSFLFKTIAPATMWRIHYSESKEKVGRSVRKLLPAVFLVRDSGALD